MQPQQQNPITNYPVPQVQPSPGYQNAMVNPAPVIVVQQKPIGCTHDATIVNYRNGKGTWIWSIILFFFFCPLFWLPFCCKSCKDKELICSRCGAVVTKRRVCC